MSLNINVPQAEVVKPKISVFGIGGAGGNALNNMITENLEGVDFIAANTDAQSLQNSLSSNRIQLGLNITKGLGAGSFPDRGKVAAEENIEEIERYLEGNNMVFITAGMGGGTGTGAAPVIAKLAKEKDILTVGVVTKPFDFEGKHRMEVALEGIEELKKYVDTLIVIPNQNLFRIANETTTFESAFKMADRVLHAGVRGVTDLITMPGLVNLDFADIKTIMTKMGKAMMGTGEAEGENRAVIACQEAISNPLLDDVSISGAKGVLVNMTGGTDMTLFEADQAVNEIRRQVDGNANIIFGSAFHEDMKGKIRVSVVATGIDSDSFEHALDTDIHEELQEEDLKTPSFFDTSAIQGHKPETDKISPEDFKSKIEIDDFIHTEQEKSKIGADLPSLNNDFLEEDRYSDGMPITQNAHNEQQFFGSDHTEMSQIDYQEDNLNVPTPIDTTKDNDNNGFSLFKFITGGKNKKKKDSSHKQQEVQDNTLPKNQDSAGFSFHENIDSHQQNFDDERAENQEDDILEIPAFFRKKDGKNKS